MEAINQLFPKARIAVLRNLLLNPEREIHLRELVRLSGLSLGAVQHELANLMKGEFVTVRKDGNRQYFKANREHQIYRELRDIFIKCDQATEILRQAIAGIPNIEAAFIFGSVAKGTERVRSDVDVMFIGGVGLRQLAGVLQPAAEQLQREINPYVLSVETLRQKLKEKDAFISNVLNESKLFIKGNEHELERLGQ